MIFVKSMDATKVVWAILVISIVDNADSQKPLLSSSGCTIPRFNISFQDGFPKGACGVRSVFINKVNTHKVQITMKKRFPSCCYSYVYRFNGSDGLKDWKVRLSPCIPVKNMETIFLKHDFIRVKCFTKDKRLIYDDYYASIKQINGLPKDKRIPKKRRRKGWRGFRKVPGVHRSKGEQLGPMYNVLVLVIGTMSRARAYNSLSGTVQFLKKNNWLDFRGYNKIARNTVPNLLALLTGSNEDIFINKTCSSDLSSCNNNFIWHEFQKRGYVTAFGEDLQLRNGSFHRHSNGFSIPPTNHYMRPLFLAGEMSSNYSVCTRRISSGLQILNYIQDLMKVYKKGVFGYFNINSFSRNIGQSPKPFDRSLINFFKHLKDTNILVNTFVIFVSDHGINQGPVRMSPKSYYDERLPMLFMHIPNSLKKTHKFMNLEANQHLVISPYDVYLTIWDMLKMSTDEVLVPKARGCPRCVSLFKYIPEDRSCSEAGISDVWCACHEITQTSVDEYGAAYSFIKSTAYLKSVSSAIATQPCTICKELSVNKLLRIHSFSLDNVSIYYVVVMRMKPENVIYEVTVRKALDHISDNFKYDVVSINLISKNNCVFNCTIDKNEAHLCLCKTIERCSPLHFSKVKP